MYVYYVHFLKFNVKFIVISITNAIFSPEIKQVDLKIDLEE